MARWPGPSRLPARQRPSTSVGRMTRSGGSPAQAGLESGGRAEPGSAGDESPWPGIPCVFLITEIMGKRRSTQKQAYAIQTKDRRIAVGFVPRVPVTGGNPPVRPARGVLPDCSGRWRYSGTVTQAGAVAALTAEAGVSPSLRRATTPSGMLSGALGGHTPGSGCYRALLGPDSSAGRAIPVPYTTFLAARPEPVRRS